MLFTRQKKLKKGLRVAVVLGAMLYVFTGTMLYFFQEKLLFRSTQLSQNHEFKFDHDFEEFFLKTDDGATLNTLFFKAESPKGAILYYHGNAGDLQRWGNIVSYFVDQHYDVYIMDYRTYGKSNGQLSEKAMYEDAMLVYEHLKEFWDDHQITIYGRSLGSAFATYVAAHNTSKQLILEAPFFSVEDVAKHRFPVFPVKKLIKFRFNNYQYIASVVCPITIIHGTDDLVVPFSSGKKLYESISNTPSNFVEVKTGGHNNLIEFKAYKDAIQKCLEE